MATKDYRAIFLTKDYVTPTTVFGRVMPSGTIMPDWAACIGEWDRTPRSPGCIQKK